MNIFRSDSLREFFMRAEKDVSITRLHGKAARTFVSCLLAYDLV
jgi:hypothetical protein